MKIQSFTKAEVMNATIAILLLAFLPVAMCGYYTASVNIKSSPDQRCPEEPCLTLNDFINQNLLHHRFQADVKLRMTFLSGNHRMETSVTDLYFSYINVSMTSVAGDETWVICESQTNMLFSGVHEVQMINLKFFGCGAFVIEKHVKNFIIESCIFHTSKVGRAITYHETTIYGEHREYTYGVIISLQSVVNIKQSSFINHTNLQIPSRYRYTTYTPLGIVRAIQSNASFSHCVFLDNYNISTILATRQSLIILSNSLFENNIITSESSSSCTNSYSSDSVIYGYDVTMQIQECTWDNNNSNNSIYCSQCILTLENSIFSNSRLSNTIKICQSKTFTAKNLVIINNKVPYFSQLLYIQGRRSESVFENVFMVRNTGHFIIEDCTAVFKNGISFIQNNGTLNITKSFVHFRSNDDFNFFAACIQTDYYIEHREFSTPFKHYYGTITVNDRSKVIFEGTTLITNNYSENGGAIRSTNSEIMMIGNNTISENTVNGNGGGVYLVSSEFICNINCSFIKNRAAGKGGGIFTSSSMAIVDADYTFEVEDVVFENFDFLRHEWEFSNNKAKEGGAIYLEHNSRIVIRDLKHSFEVAKVQDDRIVLWFLQNVADYGGAIYVSSNVKYDGHGICESTFYSKDYMNTQCFIYFESFLTPMWFESEKAYIIEFQENVATRSGASIFGGFLDRCTTLYNIPGRDERYQYSDVDDLKEPSGLALFEIYSNINTSDVSSEAVRVCYCTDNGLDCDAEKKSIVQKRDEALQILVAIVDQAKNIISGTLHVVASNTVFDTNSMKKSFKLPTVCTTVNVELINVLPVPNQVAMYAEGPCENRGISQKLLQIQWAECTCHILDFYHQITKHVSVSVIPTYRH